MNRLFVTACGRRACGEREEDGLLLATGKERQAKPHAGFTLVELLVVILLCIVLAGLFFPCMHWHGGTREAARRANCINNLKMIGLGAEMYSSKEHYGTWPSLGIVPEGSAPDLCAAELGLLYDSGNGIVGDWKAFSCMSSPCVKPDPAIDPAAETSYAWLGSWRMPETAPANMIIAADKRGNHDDGASMLYKDCHVKYQKTDSPDDDADSGSVYEPDPGATVDTWLE